MQEKDYIEELPNGAQLEMVHVEGGRFMMGSENGYEDERPIHEVNVPDFYIGKYPITNEQFVPFLNEMGNQEEGGVEWVDIDGMYEGVRCGILHNSDSFECIPELKKHPIIYVSWYGASAYCQWLSKERGKHYRLSSESEWEYAARGGKSTKNYLFSGGNKLKEVGWYNINSHGEPKAIGQKKPNELGLYDMSGNVWEWCSDILDEEEVRVVRGGSWYNFDSLCRVSFRNWFIDINRFDYSGFRIARY